MKTRRKRRTTKQYFGDAEEQAVLDYIDTTSVEIRHKIYNNILREPFRKMTESILRRYPIHIGNYDIHEVEADALSHLIVQMVKFNRDKIGKNGQKAKAFSYCQTIVRNFYKDHSKKSNKEKITMLSWEDYSSDVMSRDEFLYEIDGHHSDLEKLMEQIIKSMRSRIDNDASLKKNEVIVGEAIIEVLSNWHVLFMEDTPDGKINKKVTNKYQKNKILQLLKEQTRLNTKEIRISMKPYKEIYYLEKKSFYEEE
jgi:hypothetical protein